MKKKEKLPYKSLKEIKSKKAKLPPCILRKLIAKSKIACTNQNMVGPLVYTRGTGLNIYIYIYIWDMLGYTPKKNYKHGASEKHREK